MQNEPTKTREFAKVFLYREKQVLAFLQRDPEENLVLVVQLWSDAADHQIRALIAPEFDDQTQAVFDRLNDETIGELVEQSPLRELL